MQYRCWRRKAGVVTLLMACALLGGWIRSSVVWDYVELGNFKVGSDGGAIYRVNTGSSSSWGWNARRREALEWYHPLNKCRCNKIFCIAPYWSVVIPLTLIAAYLILWKPRKREAKP
jgi:hypothetical protein